MHLDAHHFVIQRRLDRPLADVQRGLATREPLTADGKVVAGAHGLVAFEQPFRPVAPFCHLQLRPSWVAPARLVTSKHRSVASIEIQLSTWSDTATLLELRPIARHPERWRAAWLRRFFAGAHDGADAIGALVIARAQRANETIEAMLVGAGHRGA